MKNVLDDRPASVFAFEWSVPKDIQHRCQVDKFPLVKSFALKLPTGGDELTAMEAQGNNPILYHRRLVIGCLVAVNGEKLPDDGVAAEAAYESWHAVVRNLVTIAFNELTNVKLDKEVFAKSRVAITY